MIRFLRRLLVFLLICIIPLCLVEFYGTHYLHSLNHYAVEPYADFMRQGPAERGVNTLVMGTSRAWVQYNPAILDSVLGTTTYNMGCDGRMFSTMMLKWNTYIFTGNPIPSFIIFDVGPFGLELDNERGYEREQFYPYMINCRPIRQFVWQGSFCNFFEKFFPGIRYFGIHNFKSNNWNEPYHLDGYNGKDLKYNDYMLQKTNAFDYIHKPEAIALMEKFLHDCDSMNIDVVLVLSPIYIEGQEKINDIAAMKRLYEDIAVRHNLPLLTYTDNSMCCDTANFYNATHLNALGANRFSRMLAHNLNSMGIVSK
ncbi:MAG: hypothetical protein IJV22_08000 [Bacteroidales bacterium]|nr:hypothetical protein [Bacteroidales bacterium]